MAAIEVLEGLKREVTLTLDADAVKAEKLKRLKNISRRVKIDGYRPGRVPMKVVERNYGDQAEHEALTELVNDAYRVAIKIDNLKTAGMPDIRINSVPEDTEGKSYSFIAAFEVIPEFEIKGVEGLEVTQTQASVTDADVTSMIETLRAQRVEWQKTESTAKTGDRINIDFDGKIDGEIFEGSSAKGALITLGSGGMIPGFEEALIGKNTGETVVFPVTFPEDHRAEHLKGKAAEFTVVIHNIENPLLPELDTKFAHAFGVISGDIEELKSELKENMERELQNSLQIKLKNQLMDKFAEANPIDVPEVMVMNEVMALAERSQLPKPKDEAQAQQLMALAKQAFSEEATKRAHLGLVLSKYAEQSELKLDSKFVADRLEKSVLTYENPEEVKEHFKKDKKMMESIRNLALEDQLVSLLMEHAKITIEQSDFDTIMKPKN